ncbi:Ig-like domain-containing protein [Winogradskyella sp. UBA3174]|uniref:T9SS type A sorting domain-containing protein n=1 Tax=Winogradskyella sp. UBA3174 TaxID=1947785 RepID=UPI0025D2046A|nr:Ig-like domain-containing protein [Winogradskyella sp. UBA3174]
MTKITFSIAFLFTLFSTFNSYAQLPAFPGAEGYGKYAVGGRGGQVIRVTNLNDSGAGSLRAAIDASGPRTVIFDVGGRINLQSTLTINNPFITIAGQHSVGDGITLSMEGTPNDVVLQVQTNDVIIRYLTLRRSEFEVSEQNSDNLVITNAHNVIIDHCSFSWASDENIAIYDYDGNNEANVYDITIQNSLIDTAWGGNDKGIIASGGVDRLTFYNLLFSSVGQRQPLIKNETGNYVTEDTYFEIINTVTFEGKLHASFPNNIEESGTKHLNYINNLCIDSGFSRNMLYVSTAYPVSIFTEGNISPLRTSITSPVDWDEEWSVVQPGGGSSDVQNTLNTSYRVTTPKNTPIIADGVVLINAVNLFDSLKDHVGASLPTRDSEDARAINDVETQIATAPVTSGTFPILTSGTPFTDVDNDGMPDFWEILEYGNLVSNGVVDTDIDGYTDLEEYLNQTANGQIPDVPAESVVITPNTATINLPDSVALSTAFTPVNTSNQSGAWTSSNSSIATVETNGLVTSVSEGLATITFTSNSGGFIDTAEITVTNIVIPLESVSVSPIDVTLEISENTQLTATLIPTNTTDSSGTWTSSSDLIATVDENGLVTAIGQGQVDITYTSNNASLTASSSITVIDTFFGTYEFYNASTDLLIQGITGDTDIDLTDEGNEINFRSIPQGGDLNTEVESVRVDWVGPSSGTWIESGTIYAGLPNGHVGLNFESYVVEEGTYNFTITYYSADGAGGDVVAIDNFSLNFLFDTAQVANAGIDQSICVGETTTLTATGGTNFLWNTGETSASIEVSPTETTLYNVIAFNDTGEETTSSVIVNVNTLPLVTVSDDVIILEGESTTLTAVGANAYLWSTGETSNSIIVSPLQTTTYIVFGINGGCEVQEQITVTVDEIFEASAGEDERVCENDNYEVELSANQGDSYLWSTGETSQNIIVSPLSTTDYSVTVTLGEEQSSDVVTVFVDPNPNVVIVNGESLDILSGDFITLSASGANNYEWNNGATQPNIAISPSETTVFEVRGYINDCYDDKNITINVYEPVTAYAGENVLLCLDDSIVLTASGGDEYLWSTGEITPSIEVAPAETTDYYVTVFNAVDFDEASVRVEIDFDCNLEPSDENLDFNITIYPNPANDIVNIKMQGSFETSDIKLYDLTGKLVLSKTVTNQYYDPTVNTQLNISALDVGVYIIRIKDEYNEITKRLIVN